MQNSVHDLKKNLFIIVQKGKRKERKEKTKGHDGDKNNASIILPLNLSFQSSPHNIRIGVIRKEAIKNDDRDERGSAKEGIESFFR